MVAKIKVRTNFRKEAVKKAVGDANFKSLGQAGGFVRTIARRSIRPRGKARKVKATKSNISEAQKKSFLKLLKEGDRRAIPARDPKSQIQRAGPSKPGTPPKTGPQKQLRNSIFFEVDRRNKDEVVVGPTFELFAKIGKIHEFGGRVEGRRYPKRPFMRPALNKAKPRISRFWRNSVRG